MDKYLGLDLGEKTIGIAISDDLCLTAQSLLTLARKGFDEDISSLSQIILEKGVTAIVVGLPKNMDGSLGPAAQEVLRLASLFETAFKLPVYTFDERLSTVAAEKILLEADLSRKKRRKVIDRLAAAYILQGFLDQRSYQRKREIN